MDREQDQKFIGLCLNEARKGTGWTSPNPLVGCVIARKREILASGVHLEYGGAHAELVALDKLGGLDAGREDITLYVNLEPCSHEGNTPPCVDLIIEKGVKRVVWGADDADPRSAGRARAILETADIRVVSGVYEKQARQLNEHFYHWQEKKRPFIAVKMATSLDGRIALSDGASRWITSPRSRSLVHYLRQNYDAVLVGSGTWKRDDPLLNVRADELKANRAKTKRLRDPVAILLDPGLEFDESYQIANEERKGRREVSLVVVVPEGTGDDSKARFAGRQDVEVLPVPHEDGLFVWEELFARLPEFGVYSVLVEGGRKVWTELVKRRLADKYYIFIAPRFIGSEGIPSIGELGLHDLTETPTLIFFSSSDSLGPDTLLTAYPG